MHNAIHLLKVYNSSEFRIGTWECNPLAYRKVQNIFIILSLPKNHILQLPPLYPSIVPHASPLGTLPHSLPLGIDLFCTFAVDGIIRHVTVFFRLGRL